MSSTLLYQTLNKSHFSYSIVHNHDVLQRQYKHLVWRASRMDDRKEYGEGKSKKLVDWS